MNIPAMAAGRNHAARRTHDYFRRLANNSAPAMPTPTSAIVPGSGIGVPTANAVPVEPTNTDTTAAAKLKIDFMRMLLKRRLNDIRATTRTPSLRKFRTKDENYLKSMTWRS